ncbi:hypothetical protein LTR10_023228 [Elasticomyces elasticus]|uniref:BZIP domain-containing protein n=1 Tax=Exophiala sideris TaxID=1016849 RepID=A0ABR0JJJ6_9EURO|nr:hypothetical protein LTR10_023228 [Elasticomyces elasticus]KAK5035188.1 hypothetical protein LTS07_002624 [Exophiala sideris]KAK5039460.1 hypothetical protein LTR13_003717 [Exophiala sideris]KAK5066112.1 hypothetical protein LTR69_002630 [Exophiala sideris]KAK5186789.1 hypothetical protein LTR44_000795 [Eurotiomycetes sp. CCFEE 6388]
MATEDSSTPPSAKSKQERIRDNQRRSRARRQEYLAELERRLKECHAICREADLQRVAFADLQAENARLRDLLNFAGISPELVESYGRQYIQHHQNGLAAASLRQIKPKWHAADVFPTPAPNNLPKQQPGNTRHCLSSVTPLAACTPQPTTFDNTFQNYDDSYRFSILPGQSSLGTPLSQMNISSPSYDWLFGSEAGSSNASTDGGLVCDTFNIPSSGHLVPDDDMEEIKARLSTGFARPTFPETGCRVSSQVLFQVLNDLNARKM